MKGKRERKVDSTDLRIPYFRLIPTILNPSRDFPEDPTILAPHAQLTIELRVILPSNSSSSTGPLPPSARHTSENMEKP